MPKVTALREVRYATVTYKPGDAFEASDKDAGLLERIGKVTRGKIKANPTDLPAEAAPEVAEEPAPLDEMAELRAQYQDQLGKRPFMGWDADELRERMGTYDRRDMRAED